MKIISFLAFFIILSLRHLSWGQDNSISLDTAIDLSEKTISDTLSNGFQYIIKKNEYPKNKIEIRLCLKVGSIQEKKGEEGIAHFIEHMAFEGSTHFPKKKALIFWEKLGAKFGTQINAYTGYDRTVYSLSIPSDTLQSNLKKTFEIFFDWLTELNFNKKSISKHKKIITEEIKSQQEYDTLENIKKGNTIPLKRFPIGNINQIEKIEKKHLERFYQEWYNPKNTAIIVVGDLKIKETADQIKKVFSKLKQRGTIVPKKKEIIYPSEGSFYIEKNKKLTAAKLSCIFPYQYRRNYFLKDILAKEKEKIAVKLATQRLRNRKNKLSVFRYWYLQKTGFLEFNISDKDSLITHFEKGISIIEGIKKTGIKAGEVNLVLENFTKNLLNYNQRKTSIQWAENFIEIYLFNERILCTAQNRRILIKQLKSVKLAEWNALIRQVFAFKTPMLATYKYNPNNHKLFSFSDLKKKFAVAAAKPDTTFLLKKDAENIKIKTPKNLKKPILFKNNMIVKEEYFPHIGTHSILLSNKIKLYLKPTKKSNKINLILLSKGGLNLLPPDKFKQMEDMFSYFDIGGTKNLKSPKFQDFLFQEDISLLYIIENYFHGIWATAPKGKAEILCNLIGEKLTIPELCYQDFEEIKQEEINKLKNKTDINEENPIRKMDFRLQELKGNIFPIYMKPKTIEDIKKSNLDSLYSFYKENYLSPKNIYCIVSGNFEIDSLKKYLAANLSTIKPPKTIRKQKENNYQTNIFNLKKTEEKIDKKEENRFYFRMLYYGKYKNSLRNNLILKLLSEYLRKQLLEDLRENTGLIYSPHIDVGYRSFPFPAFFLTVSGTSENQNCKRIEKIIRKIFTSSGKEKISETELKKLKKILLNSGETGFPKYNSVKQAIYLQNAVRLGINLDELEHSYKILEAITAEDILTFFRKKIMDKQRIYLYIGNCPEK